MVANMPAWHAVEVLGRLCRDTFTLHTLVNVSTNDKRRDVRNVAADALEIFDIPGSYER